MYTIISLKIDSTLLSINVLFIVNDRLTLYIKFKYYFGLKFYVKVELRVFNNLDFFV